MRKTKNKLKDPKQHITNKGAFCFCPSQPIVLYAEGENVNPLWKEELGGFTLSILISGNSLIWGEWVMGEGERVEGRMNQEEKESSRRGVVYSEYTVAAI